MDNSLKVKVNDNRLLQKSSWLGLLFMFGGFLFHCLFLLIEVLRGDEGHPDVALLGPLIMLAAVVYYTRRLVRLQREGKLLVSAYDAEIVRHEQDIQNEPQQH